MTLSMPVADARGSTDQALALLIEELTAKLQAGTAVDVQAYLHEHPEHEARLRQLLPALEMLADLGRSAGAGAVRVTPPVSPGEEVVGTLGDFRILREIGRGGMGVVYEAEQISLGRRVALKVLPFAAALDAKQLQRFKNEAHAAAGLQHTNIVPVYFVGCERGVHFYAMQYVEGQTLAALIQELRREKSVEDRESKVNRGSKIEDRGSQEGVLDSQRTGPFVEQEHSPAGRARLLPSRGQETGEKREGKEAATLVGLGSETVPVAPRSSVPDSRSSAFFHTVANLGIQAAEALEHAHQLGVIHRDIKPANMMVDARGNLWITDFGLAHCQGGVELTMSGDLLGTLRYMSPEQALAKRVIVDERSDIYSLGVTLYELLTLEPAFPGTDRQEVLRQIAFDDPKPPRRWNKAIPVELETIVLKAMEKNPADRYDTAKELAEDLQHFLDDKPLRARRPTLVQRFRKWTRRHPGVTRTAAAGLVVIALGCTVSTLLIADQRDLANARARDANENAKRADDNAAKATAKAVEAKENEKDARRRLYISDLRLAQRAWEENQIERLLELLEGQRPERTGGIDLRGFEWHYWWRLSHSHLLTLMGHTGGVTCVAYSPDGKRIVSGSDDNTLRVWDATTGRETLILKGHDYGVNTVAYSPDGKWMISGGGDIRVRDAATGQQTLTFKPRHTKAGIKSLAYSPDGKQVVSGSPDGTLMVWDATTGHEMSILKGHTRRIASVAYSPDGKQIASGGYSVKLWDAATGQEILTLKGHPGIATGVAYSPDGKRIVGGLDGTLKVWETATGQEIPIFKTRTSSITSLAYSPDGKRIATGSQDNTLRLWDAANGQEILTLKLHTGWITSLAYSPDGKQIVSGSLDKTLKVWDAVNGQETLTLKGHTGGVCVAISSDGKQIASGGGSVIKVWDAATGREVLSLKGYGSRVIISPDGKRIVSRCEEENTIKVWSAVTAQETLTLKGLWPLAYSPDGRQIVCQCQDGALRFWDAVSGEEILAFKPGTQVESLAFSPDGKRIVTNWCDISGARRGADYNAFKVWDAATGQEILTLKGHTMSVRSVAYSRDGKRIVSGSDDNTVKVWDATTGQEILTLKGHTGSVASVALSPDGRRIVSSSGILKVWDAATGQETLTLGHPGGVSDVAYSPDGRHIVSGGHNGTIKIWDGTPASEELPLAGAPLPAQETTSEAAKD